MALRFKGELVYGADFFFICWGEKGGVAEVVYLLLHDTEQIAQKCLRCGLILVHATYFVFEESKTLILREDMIKAISWY